MKKKWIDNLSIILDEYPNKKELTIVISEILEFIIKKDWRGACHESCGVFFVLLQELNIKCHWKLGEVFFKEKKVNGRAVCFDHSWILINDEIFDLSLIKTNHPEFDSQPTIRNINIDTLNGPEVTYNTGSGWGDDPVTRRIKNWPLSKYFDSSPIHKNLGTWILVQNIAKKLNISTSILELRNKYNGIYWK